MNIVKAVKADVPEIITMTRACAKHMIANGIYQWNEHYPTPAAFENDIEQDQLWLLKEGGSVIGSVVVFSIMDDEYTEIEWLTPNEKNIYIHRLAVHPEYQGKGCARMLMDFAEEYARQNNFASVRLDTFSQNPRNNVFYDKRGYQRLGDVYFPKQSEHPFHCYELVL